MINSFLTESFNWRNDFRQQNDFVHFVALNYYPRPRYPVLQWWPIYTWTSQHFECNTHIKMRKTSLFIRNTVFLIMQFEEHKSIFYWYEGVRVGSEWINERFTKKNNNFHPYCQHMRGEEVSDEDSYLWKVSAICINRSCPKPRLGRSTQITPYCT